MKIKGLLIDFDGVVVDSTRAYMKATHAAMKSLNDFKIEEGEVREISLEIARRLDKGFSREKILDGMISLPPSKNLAFLDLWLRTWNEACLWEVEPVLGAYEVLNDLSNRFPLALVTLRHLKKSLIIDQLKRLKLNGFFEAIITTLDVKKPKPNPEPFLEGAKRLCVPIGDCAIIGDSILDIRAGKVGGAKTIAVLSGLFEENALKEENPDLIVRSITEITSHLL
ncbi:MAG: HAD family hydrolase [Candidatus Hodarchaeota archaeon]